MEIFCARVALDNLLFLAIPTHTNEDSGLGEVGLRLYNELLFFFFQFSDKLEHHFV